MVATYAAELRKALEADEIVAYFQPLVELRTGLLTGFEALARWRHPVHGSIPPDVFIPLAEDTGLINPLTRNLLRRAFMAAAPLPEDLSLSFNISAIQFHNEALPEQINLAAQQAGFPLKRLILEITESALIENIDQARSIAEELKSFGVRLALDDFGTGYSSLRHLQSLPFDELKIDASFIRVMSDTRESRKIVAAVVGLGQSLGLTTVAEGIEIEAQAEMLLRLGCDLGQGWLYGPPVPASDLPSFLTSKSLSPPSTLPAQSPANGRLPILEALPTQRLAQLQAIYDGAPVGLCFIDRSLRYTSINKTLAEMNGASIADHLGRTIQEMIPEVFPNVERYLRCALQGECFNDLEIASPTLDAEGHPQTWLVSYQPARDEADEVIGVSIAVIEITKRKLVEEALRESEDHYRHSVQLNPEVPWTSDVQGMILTAGPRWEIATGLTQEQTRNDGWVKALHPDDVAPTLQIWKSSLLSGCLVDIEFRIGRGDGIWRWMRSRAAPRRDSTGNITRWYGTIEDIDDRKKAEKALRESEALLRAVFDAVPVGLVISESPSNRILMSNPRAEAIFGRAIPPGENINAYRQNAFHTDGRPLDPQEYPTVRAMSLGKSTESEDFLYPRGDGVHAWITATAAPVRGKNDEIGGAVLAVQDIDEAKRERQRLLDRVAELERELKAKS